MIRLSKLLGIESKDVLARIKEVGCRVCNLEGTLECDNMPCNHYVKYGAHNISTANYSENLIDA